MCQNSRKVTKFKKKENLPTARTLEVSRICRPIGTAFKSIDSLIVCVFVCLFIVCLIDLLIFH